MRHIRYRDSSGIVRHAIEQPAAPGESRVLFMEANEDGFVHGLTHGFTPSYRSVTTDSELLQLPSGLDLMSPLDAPEVWGAGTTFPASWRARMTEAQIVEPYEHLLEERRPHFYFKDAGGHRTVGPGEPIAIRSDATWTVPEPEIGVVIGERGAILGFTIVNDVTCRDIRARVASVPLPVEVVPGRLRDRTLGLRREVAAPPVHDLPAGHGRRRPRALLRQDLDQGDAADVPRSRRLADP